jgi:hypothetical protein
VATDARDRFDSLTMFNALRSEELLVGIGRVLRIVADAPGALEEYARSQTLSAYSVTRLLAAEQAAAPDLLAWTQAALATALEEDARPEAQTARDRIAAVASGPELGEAVGDLLAALPPADATGMRVHRVLAEMIDREVAALAALPQ